MTDADPTLVICARAPPQIGGTGTVMYELLRHFPEGSFVLFMRAQPKNISRDDRVLPVRTFEVGRAGSMVYATVFRMLLLPLLVLSIVRRVKSIGRPPRNILAVHPDLDFLLASLFLSKLLRVPIFVYLHDCIVETATQVFDKTPARIAQKLVFRNASKVYAMSAPMEKYYRDRGLRAEALPHGVDASLMRAPSPCPCSAKPRIGFAGAVYETNGSAIVDLVDAKRAMGGGIELLLATSSQSIPYLKRLGVFGALDKVSTLGTRSEMLDFLASCDILFVPMSFESPNYKDLLTIFPTKVTDYWLAQRPVLVYGPREYAFVRLAEADGYAKVVTERGGEGIAKAIRELCSSPKLRESLVAESRKMIRLHDASALARRLMTDLGIQSEDGGRA